jgi:hypothetical protein
MPRSRPWRRSIGVAAAAFTAGQWGHPAPLMSVNVRAWPGILASPMPKTADPWWGYPSFAASEGSHFSQ